MRGGNNGIAAALTISGPVGPQSLANDDDAQRRTTKAGAAASGAMAMWTLRREAVITSKVATIRIFYGFKMQNVTYVMGRGTSIFVAAQKVHAFYPSETCQHSSITLLGDNVVAVAAAREGMVFVFDALRSFYNVSLTLGTKSVVVVWAEPLAVAFLMQHVDQVLSVDIIFGRNTTVVTWGAQSRANVALLPSKPPVSNVTVRFERGAQVLSRFVYRNTSLFGAIPGGAGVTLDTSSARAVNINGAPVIASLFSFLKFFVCQNVFTRNIDANTTASVYQECGDSPTSMLFTASHRLGYIPANVNVSCDEASCYRTDTETVSLTTTATPTFTTVTGDSTHASSSSGTEAMPSTGLISPSAPPSESSTTLFSTASGGSPSSSAIVGRGTASSTTTAFSTGNGSLTTSPPVSGPPPSGLPPRRTGRLSISRTVVIREVRNHSLPPPDMATLSSSVQQASVAAVAGQGLAAGLLPMSASKASTAGRTAALFQCAYQSDSGNGDGAASVTTDTVGSASAAEFVWSGNGVTGAFLSTVFTQIAAIVLAAVLTAWRPGTPPQSVARVVAVATVCFYAPNVAGLSARVLSPATTSSGGGRVPDQAIGAVALCIEVALVLLCTRVLQCLRRPQETRAAMTKDVSNVYGNGKSSTEKNDGGSMGKTVAALLIAVLAPPLVDGIRDPLDSTARRTYASVDLAAAVVMAVVSRIQYRSAASCLVASWSLVLLSAAQLLYVIKLRPFSQRLGMAMTVIVLAGGFAFAVLCAAVASRTPVTLEAQQYIDWGAAALTGLFYLNLVVGIIAVAQQRCQATVATHRTTAGNQQGSQSESTEMESTPVAPTDGNRGGGRHRRHPDHSEGGENGVAVATDVDDAFNDRATALLLTSIPFTKPPPPHHRQTNGEGGVLLVPPANSREARNPLEYLPSSE